MEVNIIEHEMYSNKGNRIYSISFFRKPTSESAMVRLSLFSVNRTDGDIRLYSVIKLSNLKLNDFVEFVELEIGELNIEDSDSDVSILEKYITNSFNHFTKPDFKLGEPEFKITKVEISNVPLVYKLFNKTDEFGA